MKKFIYLIVSLSALLFGGQVFAACQPASEDYPTYSVTVQNKTAHHYLFWEKSTVSETCNVCSKDDKVVPGDSGKYVVQCTKPFSPATVGIGLKFVYGSSTQTCSDLGLALGSQPPMGVYGLTLTPPPMSCNPLPTYVGTPYGDKIYDQAVTICVSDSTNNQCDVPESN